MPPTLRPTVAHDAAALVRDVYGISTSAQYPALKPGVAVLSSTYTLVPAVESRVARARASARVVVPCFNDASTVTHAPSGAVSAATDWDGEVDGCSGPAPGRSAPVMNPSPTAPVATIATTATATAIQLGRPFVGGRTGLRPGCNRAPALPAVVGVGLIGGIVVDGAGAAALRAGFGRVQNGQRPR